MTVSFLLNCTLIKYFNNVLRQYFALYAIIILAIVLELFKEIAKIRMRLTEKAP